jgi:hypothetical protein
MALAALVLATMLAVTATAPEQVYDVGGVTTPVPTKIVHAQYTPDALRAGAPLRVGVDWLTRWHGP